MQETGATLYLKKVFFFLYEQIKESEERGSGKSDDIPEVSVNLTNQ